MPTDTLANDQFGHSVALSESAIAVGMIGDDDAGRDAGSVYVYSRLKFGWKLHSKLAPSELQSGDWFGYSCAISGNTLVVGARGDDDRGGNSGSVYVFERVGAEWIQVSKLYASDAQSAALFGHDLDLDGDQLVVGAWGDNELGTHAGAAYVFRRSASNRSSWLEQAKLVASDARPLDDFGRAVAIDGQRIVIGKTGDGTNGANSGAAYVFDHIGSDWVEVAKLFSSDGGKLDNFGASVSVSQSTVVVGSPADDSNGVASGAAYVFKRVDGAWSEAFKLAPLDGDPGAQFGTSVGVRENRILVGASNDSQRLSGSGSVYEFVRSSEAWLEVKKFVASDAEQLDGLGWDLDLGDCGFIAGASNSDASGNNSGSAYLFELQDLFRAH